MGATAERTGVPHPERPPRGLTGSIAPWAEWHVDWPRLLVADKVRRRLPGWLGSKAKLSNAAERG